MKRFVKYGLVAAGAVAILWGLLALAVWIAFPPAKVKSLVLEKASAQLHRKVALESAGVRVFPFLGVSLKGLSVANNPDSGFSSEPLASLASLDVRISPLSLLKFSPVVDAIVLEKPAVRLEILADGRTGLDGLGGPKDTTSKPKTDSVKALELPFPLTVRRIEIRGGSAAYIDRKAGREIVVGNLDQEISLSTDKSLQNVETKGKLEIKDLSVSGSGLPVRKGGIRISVEHDLALNLPGAAVEIRRVRASMQDMGITLSGKASNILVRPVLDLKLASDAPIDLSKLLAEVPKEISPEIAKVSLSGLVDFAFTAQGAVDAASVPMVDGALHVRGMAASVQGLPAKLANVNARLAIKGTRSIQIDSTSWTLNDAPGSLLLRVDSLPVPPHKSIPVLLELEAKGKVDLGAFAQIAAPFVPALDSLKPEGQLGWLVKGSGPLDPKNPAGLKIEGSATLAKVSAKLPGLPDRPVVDGSASLSNASMGANVAIAMGPTDLSVDAKVADWLALVLPKLAEGKVTAVVVAAKSRKIDLDRLLPPSDTTKKKAESAPMTEIPELPPVSLQATFQADLIQAMGLSLTGAAGKASLVKGVFSESFGAALAQGKLSQNLTADLNDRKAPSVHLAADLAGVQIHDVLVGMKDRLPPGAARALHDKILGKASGKVTASVKAPIPDLGKKLTADISGSVADGKIVNFPAVASLTSKAHAILPGVPEVKELAFQTMSVQAQLLDGKLIVKDLKMDGSSLGAIQGNGSIGVDQSLDLHLDTHFPQGVSGSMQSVAGSAISSLGLPVGSPLPQDEQKRVVLSWLVKGTIASPSVSPDLPRVSDLAKGAAAALASEAKARLQKEADELKERARREADAQAEKLKQQAAQKASDEAKKALGAQGGKAVDQVKNKATDALKGIKKPW